MVQLKVPSAVAVPAERLPVVALVKVPFSAKM